MHQPRFCLRFILGSVVLLSALFSGHFRPVTQARVAQTSIVTVSAASFELAALAPGAIVASFGTALATRVEVSTSVPLPTTLAGTTALVKDSAGTERAAALFFVSPDQVNFAIPLASAVGTATLTIRSGDGTTSTGTLEIKAVAPAIFTANANGQGAPAAVALRIRSNGQQSFETVAVFDAALGSQRPRPLDLSPTGDRVFLILFMTGTQRATDPNNDGNRNETVHLLLGGVEVTPEFVGPQGTLVGLDQMNVELPRSLIGSGRISAAITGPGLTSNAVELDIAAAVGTAPPAVSGFNAAQVLAGQTVVIQGSGFAAQAANNQVRIGGYEAVVTNATATNLSVLVPYGAETGIVSVQTPTGSGSSSNALQIRTSISGLVENTERQPLKDVAVRLRGTANVANTTSNGGFILPDPPTNVPFSIVEIDGSKLAVNPPYGKLTLLTTAQPNRDNQVARPVTLQQINGTSAQVGGSGTAEEEISLAVPTYDLTEPEQSPIQIQTGNVTLGLAANTRFQFPDGTTRGVLTLTQVASSRLPVNFPSGVFSSTIVQITPFGTQFTPGARLTFPNNDGYAANATVKLFRLDQTPDSPTLGRLIVSGMATVSADGQTIVTPASAVPEATYYFTALERTTTTVIGRVLDADRTPLRRALVRCRGQEDFTDGNGGFVLRNVAVRPGTDALIVEASVLRANGRVDRVQSNSTNVVSNGVTNVGTLTMPAANSNQPPTLLISPQLTANAGETRDFAFIADDPDSTQSVRLTLNGPAFASVTTAPLALRLAPTVRDVGTQTLTLTATDAAGASTSKQITVTVVAAFGAVQGTVRNAVTGQVLAGATIALSNTNLSTTSASNGTYALANVPPGNYTLTAAASGFVTTQFSITVTANQTLTQNLSLSTVLTAGQLRITLNWTKNANGTPDDLDAHLFGPNGNNECFHVYWADTGDLSGPPFAALEVDNIELTGHPPTETIRIAHQTSGIYRFFVHNYENEQADGLSQSRATVQIFNSSGLLRTYTVPSGAGEYWHVFELNSATGALTDVNRLADEEPDFACGGTFTVSEHWTTAEPLAQGCAPPTPKSAFLITDPRVYFWGRVRNVTAGDVLRVEFRQPSGAVQTSGNVTFGFSGSGCFSAPLDIAGAAPASLPGNWQARAYFKDNLMATDNFTISRSASSAPLTLTAPATPASASQSRARKRKPKP